MPIWRLIPVDLADPNWEASSHRAPAVVRAPDEAAARAVAEAAFGVRSRFAATKGMRVPPWSRSGLVRAALVEDSIHAADGPNEVLEPSFDQDLSSRRAPKEPTTIKRRGRAHRVTR